jgi:glyoxylase-like metal-dependent hydrolase (beta-lactamase superfamily II)
VDTGDRRFSVLHLPGHSPGSIALLDEANGEFFAGDAIYQGGLVDDIPGADVAVYMETMRRLSGLDVGIVHAGHGPSIGGATMRAIALGYIADRQRRGA